MAAIQRIEIELSKLKLGKFLVFSALFLFIGIWMFRSNPQVGNTIFNNPVVKYFGACMGILMGTLGIFFFTKKLFDKKPGIIIEETGVTVNSGAFGFSHVPWEDIGGIFERTVHAGLFSKQRFVTITLQDPEAFILKEPNKMKQKLMFLNSKNYGSPIHISTNGLKIKHEALLDLLKSNLEQYKTLHREI